MSDIGTVRPNAFVCFEAVYMTPVDGRNGSISRHDVSDRVRSHHT